MATTRGAVTKKFLGLASCRIAIEVGAHSPWVSRLLTELGHEVIVANARKVQLISASSKKDDRMDAKMPAKLARIDPGLLGPIRRRSEETQLDLMVIRVRSALVEARIALINTARGLAKPVGRWAAVARLRCRHDGCGTAGRFAERIKEKQPTNRADRRDQTPGNQAAERSQRSRTFDRSDVGLDDRGSGPLRKEAGT